MTLAHSLTHSKNSAACLLTPPASGRPGSTPLPHYAHCFLRATVVSKGGNFLLDVPPMADGSFDARVTATLLSMGQWLGVYGAGIYKSIPWRAFGEGPTNIVPGRRSHHVPHAIGPSTFHTCSSHLIWYMGHPLPTIPLHMLTI
jgi:hypothetical protein